MNVNLLNIGFACSDPVYVLSVCVCVQALRDSGNDVVEAIMKVRANLR